MPVAPQIANAAYSFSRNASLLNKGLAGLAQDDWLRRPNDSCNHILWIAGHVIWARGRALHFLGVERSKPWPDHFARGAKLVDSSEYPKPEEILLAWEEISAQLTAALEAATDETLGKPSPERISSADGKISGVLMFFASHETYHVGQVAYLRTWLGHDGVAG
jgi:hypothetical protein